MRRDPTWEQPGVSDVRVIRVIARMNVGGPALQVTGLTRHLDDLGFESRLLVGSVAEGEEDFLSLRAPDLPHVVVEGLGRRVSLLSDARAFLSIFREIRSFRPDVVHTHTAKAGVLGRVAARLAGVPVVVHTFHGHLLKGYFSKPATRAVILIESTLARMTTVLASVGSRVRDELVQAGIGATSQYVVVPPGVPLPERHDRNEARTAFDIPDDVGVVTFVGRLTGVKRFDRFTEMARLLVDSGQDVRFLVVGGGDLHQAKEATADLGHRFVFTGWLGDVGLAYAASDVIALTSDNEGMPVTLIEAQMCGVPAVATDVGSVREVVLDGETGFVVEADPVILADAVDRLLGDRSLREAFGRRAAEWARSAFSTQRLVDDTARIYREALESQSARRKR